VRRLSREAGELYRRIVQTYASWFRTLLPLAVIVFVPLGLIHAIPTHVEVTQLDLGSGLHVLAIVIAALALTAGGLLGEVFYAGVVAIALTHPHDGEPPTLREIAGMISYGRLIAVDLIYVDLVLIGFAAFVVPGILLYIYLGLAAPVVEIEGRGVRAGFRRSVQLVRGHFWLVAAVLVPLEILGDGLTALATDLANGLLGDTILDEWFVDAVTNVLFTPFYAVAAVLLTLKLISDAGEEAPVLHSEPPSS
jgi:hypothetical protein